MNGWKKCDYRIRMNFSSAQSKLSGCIKLGFECGLLRGPLEMRLVFCLFSSVASDG